MRKSNLPMSSKNNKCTDKPNLVILVIVIVINKANKLISNQKIVLKMKSKMKIKLSTIPLIKNNNNKRKLMGKDHLITGNNNNYNNKRRKKKKKMNKKKNNSKTKNKLMK